MTHERVGYIQLILFSVVVGTVGVFVKLVEGLDVYSIVFFRAAIAVVFIFLMTLCLKGFKELRLVRPLQTLLVGLFQGLSIFLYFMAILQTSVTNAVFLLYTAPVFSVILAHYFLKEKIEKETVIGVLVTVIGIMFILQPGTFTFVPEEAWGNLMGLGSGFFYAAMALTAKPIMKKKSGYYIAFWQYLVISLMFVGFLGIDSSEVIFQNWWQLGMIGIFCTGLAFILFMEGVRKVKAQKIFVITALEPLAGTFLALILLAEMPSILTVMGSGLILYGVYRTTRQSPELL